MLPKDKAIEKLQILIDRIESLKEFDDDSHEFTKWQRDVEVSIENIFGTASRHINDFYAIEFYHSGNPFYLEDSEYQETYLDGLNKAKAILSSMIDEINEFWTEEEAGDNEKKQKPQHSLGSKKVFIIHGHDSGLKETVARFISQIGLEPIILHEQPNQGQTIIEKFEEHSEDTAFAIALLTPDDIAKSVKHSEEQYRARQNVIFEFGYFIGSLGRKHVIGLVKNDIELPSDYSGVLYIPLDESETWKIRLVKEFKSIGFDIDANKVF